MAPVAPDLGAVEPPGTHDVALVGLGYVGLPTALAFAAAGRTVLGLDASRARLAAIAGGQADLLERDRGRLADVTRHPARLTTTDDPTLLREAEAVIVCVPTPIDDHLVPDLAPLRAACRTVVEQARPGQLLVLTSTTYVGCTRDLLVEPLRARGLDVGTDVFVAFSPERIDPGNEAHLIEDVPRVVGGVTAECTRRACALLGTYGASTHAVASPAAAEMVKLVENTFRAVNIALANEFADACRVLGLSVMDVIAGAATKPYGFMPFYPGPGVGGHCIPCDPHYLLWQLRRHRVRIPVTEQAMASIAARPRDVVDRARTVLSDHGRGLPGTRVLVSGVAYKPDVQDVRESPALEIYAELRDHGADVAFYDPLVPSIRLADGTTAYGLDSPTAHDPELAVLVCHHAGEDLTWATHVPLVLDATFRLASEHGWDTL
ncbi:UDP-glucose 6-dehydrogenase [Arsenicicoccus sp. oral taxon 190]|nr:UDP-glucose 6-dehydrogenase [Arsenicicoccus sp. oral taxon 190]